MQPEQVLSRLSKRVKKEWVICFLASMTFGLLAHIFKLTNFLPNWDSLLNLYTDQDKISLGRCFLTYACSVSSYYDLPWLNGLLSLVYIAVSAVCVAELFEIKKTIPLVLLGGFMAAFPTVTSTLAYNYTADGYFLALVCMCAAVLLAVRCRRGIVPAAALIAFGVGIYQSYITFAMVLMLIYLIDQMLFYNMELKRFWKTAGKFMICGILGAAGYMISMKLILLLSGISLSEYQGISDAFSLQELHPFTSVYRAWNGFQMYFFDFSGGMNLFLILNVLLMLLLLGLFLLAFWQKKTFRDLPRLGLILACMAAIPFASYALYFANAALDYHNIMTMCLCLIYFLPLLFYERLTDRPVRLMDISRWAVIGVSVLTIYNFTVIANICYQKMQMAYERSYGVIVRVADRIEQLPEAKNCGKIAVIGCLPGSEAIGIPFPPNMTGITDGYIIRKQDTMMHENVTQAMLRDYCGLSFGDTSEEEIQEICRTDRFAEMGNWPEQGSIAVIDNTLVVKFGEKIDE